MIAVVGRPEVGRTGTQFSQAEESRRLRAVEEAVNAQTASPQFVLRDVLAEIDQLQELEDDWNGEGGRSTSIAAISLAKQLVSVISRSLDVAGYSGVRPDVAPDPDGGVGLSWDIGNTLAWLIVPPTGHSVTCVIRQGDTVPQRLVLSPGYAVQAIFLALQNR